MEEDNDIDNDVAVSSDTFLDHEAFIFVSKDNDDNHQDIIEDYLVNSSTDVRLSSSKYYEYIDRLLLARLYHNVGSFNSSMQDGGSIEDLRAARGHNLLDSEGFVRRGRGILALTFRNEDSFNPQPDHLQSLS